MLIREVAERQMRLASIHRQPVRSHTDFVGCAWPPLLSTGGLLPLIQRSMGPEERRSSFSTKGPHARVNKVVNAHPLIHAYIASSDWSILCVAMSCRECPRSLFYRSFGTAPGVSRAHWCWYLTRTDCASRNGKREFLHHGKLCAQ